MTIQPFKYQRSYGWLFWLMIGILIAAFVLFVLTKMDWLMEAVIVTELLTFATLELVSGCAIDKSFVASISRQESPIFFWLSIVFKVWIACVFLIGSHISK